MTTYVYRNGRVVPKSTAAPIVGSGPQVISDTMQAMRHPVTGKLMDSKSQFRRVTRAAGCVEVGNEVQRDTRKLEGFDTASRKRDIAHAIAELGG